MVRREMADRKCAARTAFLFEGLRPHRIEMLCRHDDGIILHRVANYVVEHIDLYSAFRGVTGVASPPQL